jgi:hypothetical protein
VPLQKLIPVYPRKESVIPFEQNRVFEKNQLPHLLIGDFDFGIQGTVDT